MQGSRWWEKLGLTIATQEGKTSREQQRQQIATDILRTVKPVDFVVTDENGVETRLAFDDLAHEIAKAQREHDERTKQAAAERSALGWERMNTALAAPDASTPITEGKWAGFTRGQAIAWCWNLFQFEPKGFVLPNSIVREKAMRELEQGGIPDVFGYPDRARHLERHGVTPESYRKHQEALGKPTFDPADVSFSTR